MITLDTLRPPQFRSHPHATVEAALASGEEAWLFSGEGDADVLLGTRDEVVADLLVHYERTAWRHGWLLTEVAA